MSLHGFTALDSSFANTDGAYPAAGLVLLGNGLYGTAGQGGTPGRGTVFKVNLDGTSFSVLHSFTVSDPTSGTNGDGAFPLGGLVGAGNNLYGTTSAGGGAANGTVFKMNLDGGSFATLHSFTASDPNTGANSDGSSPWYGLILSGNTLYGTATRGGDSGSGTVFKLSTDGTGFMRLHSFPALDVNTLTNSDGAYPLSGLVLSNNALYGTTYRGGALATGTVFKVNVDGTGFTTLHNSDGGPRGTLVLSGDTLYGTTESGGSSGHGTVFKVNADGTGFTNLETFADGAAAAPWAGLILSGSTLYGTTFQGGSSSQGAVFQVGTDGTGFTNLYSFTGGVDGAQPQAGLILAGEILYGTTSTGGSSAAGTVFSLSLSGGAGSGLTINPLGPNVVLTWPTNATGLTLQFATNLVPTVSWAVVSPGPTVVNGQNTVTNPIAGSQKFYRLSP